MSLPPNTVLIKRKATDDPLDVLRVHEPNAKRQLREFVFLRQPVPEAGKGVTDNQTLIPTGRKIKPLHGSRSSQSLSHNNPKENAPGLQSQTTQDGEQSSSNPTVGSSSTLPQGVMPPQNSSVNKDSLGSGLKGSQLREFRMSRTTTSKQPLSPILGRKGRKRPAPVVFMEKKLKTKSGVRRVPTSQLSQNISEELAQSDAHASRPQKKPGLSARIFISPKAAITPKPTKNVLSAPTPEIRVPSGITMRWDVNSDQLAAEMQTYTLQQISRNIAEADNFQPGVKNGTHKNSPSKFKPKKPALRYRERYPEEAVDEETMDVDESFSADEMDDTEYIFDTYIRIPAHTLESSDEPKNIGLLVLDSQPDIDEFYLVEWDTDEEDEDDDEDENDENHYTADYPEDEVDSDDEYDRNAYLYRTHNASDLEEFDEDDATFSDDETDGTKYPWAKKPWMKQPEEKLNLDD